MIEVTFKKESQGNTFLKIKETLQRIGIVGKPLLIKMKLDPENAKPRLIQTCGILSKGGKYYLVHFKTMLGMDGNKVKLDEEDKKRVLFIRDLLVSFGLIEGEIPKEKLSPKSLGLTVIKNKDRSKYDLVSKYSIGKKKGDSITYIPLQ